MRKQASLKTVKNTTIRPFGFSDASVWSELQYRFDTAEGWRSVLERPMLVLPNAFQDVRRDARHSFRGQIDAEALMLAGVDPSEIELLLIVRDNFAKRIHIVQRHSLGEGFDVEWDVPLDVCEQLSAARRIEFEFILATRSRTNFRAVEVKPYGRLAKHVVVVSTESQGISFNFIKVSSKELEAQGLPGRTTWHLIVKNPRDLIEECDDVSEVLRVLVHEDAWLALQEIRAGDTTGEAIGTLFTSELVGTILAIAANIPDLRRDEVVEGSVADRIFSWLAGRAANIDQLLDMFIDEGGFHDISARVQDAIRLTRSLRLLHLERSADE